MFLVKTCSVEDCHEPSVGHGMCNNHYMKAKVHDQLGYTKRCEYDGCNEPHYALGLCSSHWGKLKRNGTPDGSDFFVHKTCTIEGCENRATRRGWCGKHYQRWKKFGDPEYGVKEVAAKGEGEKWIKEHANYPDKENCLEWPFGRYNNGYGVCRAFGEFLAHRSMAIEVHGPSPFEGAEVRHLCGKGHEGCVNPHHLAWGSSKENNHDRAIHGTDNKGERHGMSKLTKENIYEIRRLYDCKGSMKVASEKFEIGVRYARQIGKRKAWTWLEEEK